jgi:pimeloyl-[acyl-carrier protein] methyl ester esterase
MSLHVEIIGQGPDLVLLHGWGLHGGAWGPWLEDLTQRARLHVVDLPGHGFSSWPRAATTLAALASHIGEAVPDGAHVLGWSLGGMLALELARQGRRPLAGLILIAATPRFVAGDDWPWGMPEPTLAGFAERLRVDHRRTVQAFLALQTLGDEHQQQTLRALRVAVAARPEPAPEALTIGLEILRVADLRSALPRIETPAIVIAGERDRLTPPAASARIAESLPSACFWLIARAAHAPFLSHAEEVLAAVDAVLGPTRATARDGARA